MKYLMIVTDGAADWKIPSLGDRTPLEAAALPNINQLAAAGTVGKVKTVPDNMSPGSDIANLSVLGYDPAVYHTGRSPLEAASIGIDLNGTDAAFRCNLVTLKGEGSYDDLLVVDHSSGDISTEEADVLIQVVQKAFGTDRIRFYTGVSYRHAMIVHHGDVHYELTPPHDILDRKAGDYLPKGQGSEFIKTMMKESYEILKNHPVNQARINRGLNPANSIWIWGQGRKPALASFYEKYGVRGAAISAVDLIKGIGILAGMEAINVPGATGTIHTNFSGKAEAAIRQFQEGKDFVFIHLEAPDECSHQGDLEGKIKSLEKIDALVVAPLVRYLAEKGEDYRILIVPDHETPLKIRTHAREAVPFVLYDSANGVEYDQNRTFSETAGMSGLYFDNGYELTDFFFGRSK